MLEILRGKKLAIRLAAALSLTGMALTGAVGVSSAAAPKSGGTLNISTPAEVAFTSLDPTVTVNFVDLLNDVYDGLFHQGPKGTIKPGIATGYKFADKNLEVRVFLRKGVKFSDGTPLNAAAVQWNWQRDLDPKTACTCATTFTPVKSVTTNGQYEVDMHLSSPFGAAIAAMVNTTLDWIISPTAFKKEGATTFGQHPVGAGPFILKSLVPTSKAVLVKNPNFWDKPLPYVNGINIQVIDNDPAAYTALKSGQTNVAFLITTPQLWASAPKDGLQAVGLPATSIWYFNFDTYKAPMNNIIAREAVEYATNKAPVEKAFYAGKDPLVEAPVTPGDLFYEKTVPGYRTYNLAKAKALVQKLGGLKIDYFTGSAAGGEAISEAYFSQWQQAGITATYKQANTLTQYDSIVANHQFDMAMGSGLGGFDDSINTSMTNDFECHGLTTYVCDPKLDKLFLQARATANLQQRGKVVHQLLAYINSQAYNYALYENSEYTLAAKNIENINQGTGNTLYDQVWIKS